MAKQDTGKQLTIVDKVNVSNNINMNLNQNDLVELAIEEKVEQLSISISNIELLIVENNKKCQDALAKLKLDIVTKTLSKMKDYTQVFTIATELKLDIKQDVNISLDTYNDKRVLIGSYNVVDLDNVQQYKDPVSYAKRNHSTSTRHVNIAEGLTVSLKACEGNLSLDYKTKISITQKQYSDVVTPFLKQEVALGKSLFDLKMEYLNYRYGEKRIKAQITKAALRNTSEGKNILAMLEKATNVKLLN